MNSEDKKRLKEQYANRHPDMGIVCWQSGERKWIAISKDVNADYNGTSFQLKLGSWPNRELQAEYTKAPDTFSWCVLKKLEYKELDDSIDEELELLWMMVMEEFPDAKRMKPGRKK